MRRADRQVEGRAALEAILQRCKVLHLAMTDGERPYVVPLNFGYVWKESLVLYCHSATEGRKIDMLAANPLVCFCMDCDHQLLVGPNDCSYGWAYASLIGEGIARFLTGNSQKREGLRALMRHQAGRDAFDCTDDVLDKVTVFAIEVTELSGKRHAEP